MASSESETSIVPLNSTQFMEKLRKNVHGFFLTTPCIIIQNGKFVSTTKGIDLTTIKTFHVVLYNNNQKFKYKYLKLFGANEGYTLAIPISDSEGTEGAEIVKKFAKFLNSIRAKSTSAGIEDVVAKIEELHNLIAYQPFGLIEQQMKIAFDYNNFQQEHLNLIETKIDPSEEQPISTNSTEFT